MNTDRDQRDSAAQRALRLEERNFRIPDSNRGSRFEAQSTRRPTGRNGSDQYAGPCPAVRRHVSDGVRFRAAAGYWPIWNVSLPMCTMRTFPGVGMLN